MIKKITNDRLILISSSDISRSAYASHVISLLDALNTTCDINLALFSFRENELNEDNLILLDRMHNLKRIVGVEDLFFFTSKNPFALNAQVKTIINYIDKHKNQKLCILCQNYYAGFLGCLVKKDISQVHLHVDFKGIVPEEHLFYSNSGFIKRFFLYVGAKVLEKYIFKYADSFSTVSHNFKSHFQKKYNIGTRPFLVLPSAVNTNQFYYSDKIREEYRRKLGYDDDDIVVTYSGSFQEWQQPEKIFEFFKQTSKYAHYKFLILTLDVHNAKRLAEKYALQNGTFQIYTLPPVDVNNYLNASDICILLRKNDLVNNVSSPTKFGEYFVTKNKILISKGVGDFSKIVAESQYGLCLAELNINIDEVIQKIENKRKPTDEEINEFKKEYSLDQNVEKLSEILRMVK